MRIEIEQMLDNLQSADDLLSALSKLSWRTIHWELAAEVRGSQTSTAESLLPDEKLDFVVNLLNNDNPHVQREAVYLVGQLGGFNQVEALQVAAMKSDSDPAIRVAACEALATVGGPQAIETLVKCSLPGNPDRVVQAAVLALASIPGARGVLGPSGGTGGYIKEEIDSVAHHHTSPGIRLLAQSLSERL